MNASTITKPLVEITARGPSVAGVTVYSLMDYIKADWSTAEILEVTPQISAAQLEAVYEYIDQHRAEVEAEYAAILAREAAAQAESVRMLRERGLYTADLPLEERRQRLLKKLNEREQPAQSDNENRAAA